MKQTTQDLMTLQKVKSDYDAAKEFKKALQDKPLTESQMKKMVMNNKDLTTKEKTNLLITYSKHLRNQGMLVDDPEPTFEQFKDDQYEEDPKILPVRATTIQQMTREQFQELKTVRFSVFQDTSTKNHTAFHYIGKNGKQYTAGNIDAMTVKIENKIINYDGNGYADITIQAIDQADKEARTGKTAVPNLLKHISENRGKYHSFGPVAPVQAAE